MSLARLAVSCSVVCLVALWGAGCSTTDAVGADVVDASVDHNPDAHDATDATDASEDGDAPNGCDPTCPANSVKIGDDCSDFPDGKVCVRDVEGNCPVVGAPTPMICRAVDGGKVWQFPLAT